jgi:hypothetical protein
MPYSNSVANQSTQNTTPVQVNFDVNGNCLGLVGQSGNYFSPPMSGNTITNPTITGGTIVNTSANLSSFSLNGALVANSTLPVVASGFGTGPVVTAVNNHAFAIKVGTGGAANGVITFPTATNGWIVYAADVTSGSTLNLQQTGSSTTSATVTSYSITTGLAANMNANDVILITAFAY